VFANVYVAPSGTRGADPRADRGGACLLPNHRAFGRVAGVADRRGACVCDPPKIARSMNFPIPDPVTGRLILANVTLCVVADTAVFIQHAETAACYQPLENFTCGCVEGSAQIALQLAFYNETTATVEAGVMVLCGQPERQYNGPLSAQATTGATAASALAGPAAGLIQAGGMLASSPCGGSDTENLGGKSALVPFSMPVERIGDFLALMTLAFGPLALHALAATVMWKLKARKQKRLLAMLEERAQEKIAQGELTLDISDNPLSTSQINVDFVGVAPPDALVHEESAAIQAISSSRQQLTEAEAVRAAALQLAISTGDITLELDRSMEELGISRNADGLLHDANGAIYKDEDLLQRARASVAETKLGIVTSPGKKVDEDFTDPEFATLGQLDLFLRGAQTVKFPNFTVNVLYFIFPGICFESFRLVMPRNGMPRDGVEILCGTIGLVFVTAFLLVTHKWGTEAGRNQDLLNVVFVNYERALGHCPWIVRRVLPRGFWRGSHHFISRFGAFYEQFSEVHIKWITGSHLIKALVAALLATVDPGADNCPLMLLILAGFFFAYALFMLILRPHRKPTDDALVVVLTAVTGVMALVMVYPREPWNAKLLYSILLYSALASLPFTLGIGAMEFLMWRKLEERRLREEDEARRQADKGVAAGESDADFEDIRSDIVDDIIDDPVTKARAAAAAAAVAAAEAKMASAVADSSGALEKVSDAAAAAATAQAACDAIPETPDDAAVRALARQSHHNAESAAAALAAALDALDAVEAAEAAAATAHAAKTAEDRARRAKAEAAGGAAAYGVVNSTSVAVNADSDVDDHTANARRLSTTARGAARQAFAHAATASADWAAAAALAAAGVAMKLRTAESTRSAHACIATESEKRNEAEAAEAEACDRITAAAVESVADALRRQQERIDAAVRRKIEEEVKRRAEAEVAAASIPPPLPPLLLAPVPAVIEEAVASVAEEPSAKECRFKGTKESLTALKRGDFSELKVMATPPKRVQLVFEATLILLGSEDLSWAAAKKAMSRNLLRELQEMRPDAVTADKIAQLRPYIESPEFTPDLVGASSAAALALCKWVIAVYEFNHQDGRERQAKFAAAARLVGVKGAVKLK